MVPGNTLVTLATVYAICALLSLAVLYWMRNPDKMREVLRRASILILGLLSYPVVVISIILTHIFQCVVTIARYTMGRVCGQKITRFTVTVTFD